MINWLVHGFNVTDAGRGSVLKLAPHLPPVATGYSYGWTGLLGLHRANSKALKELGPMVRTGDVLIAHSNGCLVAWELAQRYPLAAVVCINPALRRDARWPEGLPVLCLHNTTDWVVQLGRMWGRLYPHDGIETQGWGAAGRYGFTVPNPCLDNFDTAMGSWEKPVKGHSGVFKEPEYWGAIVDNWMRIQKGEDERGY